MSLGDAFSNLTGKYFSVTGFYLNILFFVPVLIKISSAIYAVWFRVACCVCVQHA